MADELELLRQLFDTDPPRPQRNDLDFLIDRVADHMLAEEPIATLVVRRHRFRRGLLGGVAASTVAAGITAGILVLGATFGLTISKAAATTLQKTAQAAGAAPGVPAGDYLYTSSSISELQLAQDNGAPQPSTPQVTTIPVTEVEQTWVDGNGAGRWQISTTEPSNEQALSGTFTSANEPPFVISPSGWPTSPPGLKVAIEQRLEGGQADNYATFGFAALLASETSNSTLASSCYQVMATLPGITDFGPTQDPLGRTGTGIGMTSDGIRTEAILDPSTGETLAITNTIVNPGASNGPYTALAAETVLNSQSFTTRSTVSSSSTQP